MTGRAAAVPTTPAGRPEDTAGEAPAAFAILRSEIRAMKELLESKLLALERVVMQRLDLSDGALQLQAAEYERRLEVLNHAHTAAQERDDEFLRREIFDEAVRDIRVRLEALSLKQVQIVSDLGTLQAGIAALHAVQASHVVTMGEVRTKFEDANKGHILLTAEVGALASRHAALNASIVWLSRLVIGALVSGVIALGFAVLH